MRTYHSVSLHSSLLSKNKYKYTKYNENISDAFIERLKSIVNMFFRSLRRTLVDGGMSRLETRRAGLPVPTSTNAKNPT